MLKIESVFAFVVEDDNDDVEGVIGLNTSDGWMPMVGADMAMVERLRPFAQNIASSLGKPVKLLHFTNRTDVETLDP